jgi:hypothetical protein
VRSFDFVNQAMLCKQAQQAGDLPRLTATLLVGAGLGMQQLADVSVAKAVDRELASQRDFRNPSVWTGQRLQTAEAATLTPNRLTNRIGNLAEGFARVDRGQWSQSTDPAVKPRSAVVVNKVFSWIYRASGRKNVGIARGTPMGDDTVTLMRGQISKLRQMSEAEIRMRKEAHRVEHRRPPHVSG